MGRVLRAQKELTRSRCSQRTPGLGQDTRLHGHQCASGWCCTGEAQAARGQCGWRARGCEGFAEEAMLHLFLAGEGTGQVLPKQEREGGNGHSRLTTAEGSGATGYVNQNRDAQRSGGKRVGREASGGKGEKAHHTTPQTPSGFPPPRVHCPGGSWRETGVPQSEGERRPSSVTFCRKGETREASGQTWSPPPGAWVRNSSG